MTQRQNALLLWSPRVLGILVCLFLGLFALDAFGEGQTRGEAIATFVVHLSPMLAMLFVVGLSWRWKWVGGLVFTAVAFSYAYVARSHPSWVLVIAVPLLVVGVLFLWSWRRQGELRRV